MSGRVDRMGVLVFMIGLSSCGTDIDVDEDDPVFPLAASYCAAFAECDCPGYPAQSYSREACEQQMIDVLGNPQLEAVRAQYPEMEFAIDPMCIAELEAWTEGLQCNGESTHVIDCAAMHCVGNTISGPLVAGERCEAEAQCGPGLLCDRGPDGNDICVDVCAQVPSAVGGPCGAWGQGCVDGLVCLAGFCAQPGTLGEPCDANSCADGLYCADGCQPELADGEACESPAACASHRCIEGVCADLAQLGDSCDRQNLVCADGLTCFDGECTELPLLCAR